MDVSIYRLQDGKYQTSYVDPTSNKRVRAKFRYYNEAIAFQKNIISQHRSATLNTQGSTPLNDFVLGYLEKYPQAKMFNRSPYVYESFIHSFGKMPVGHINKMHLNQWLEKIQKEKQYSARTLLLTKYCFTPFFNYLLNLGVIGKNPLSQVKLSRNGHRKKERVYLALSEAKEIFERLKIVSTREVYPVSYFQLHTAAYIGEVVSLKWDKVDFDKGNVTFPDAGNTNNRTLTLNTQLLEILKSLPRNSEFVFTREDNQPWSVNSYYRKFAKIRKQIAFGKTFDNYTFRHTFAYHFLRKGGTLTQLQVLLGHRSIDMTVYMYGSIMAKDVEKTTPYNF